EEAETRVVDQELRREAALAQFVLDPRCGTGLAEIHGDDMRPAVAAGFDGFGERVELWRAARDQDERMAVVGENIGKSRADAGGGAGDQGNGFNVRHGVRHT